MAANHRSDARRGSGLTRRQLGRAAIGTGLAALLPTTLRAQSPPSTASVAPEATLRLAGVKSWAYQLQKANFQQLARSPYDLLVVDSTVNGDHEKPLTPQQVKRLQTRPNGSKRIVLAYVSIGEAEDYRFYWQEDWLEVATPDPPPSPAPAAKGAAAAPAPTPPAGTAAASTKATPKPEKPDRWLSPKAPPWLEDENETWGGNFGVKYWDPDWQKLMFGSPGAYIERVLAQGFDGVYLDRVDAVYNHQDERPTAADDMADFVIRLAAAARRIRPDCIVVPQNGEELLLKPEYVQAIDGIAKEDLLFGSPTESELNLEQQVANSLRWLLPAKEAKRAVLVVEYLARADLKAIARTELDKLGFVPYFAPRSLDTLWLPETPAEVKAAQSAAAKAVAAGANPNATPEPQSAKAKPKTKASTKGRRR